MGNVISVCFEERKKPFQKSGQASKRGIMALKSFCVSQAILHFLFSYWSLIKDEQRWKVALFFWQVAFLKVVQ